MQDIIEGDDISLPRLFAITLNIVARLLVVALIPKSAAHAHLCGSR